MQNKSILEGLAHSKTLPKNQGKNKDNNQEKISYLENRIRVLEAICNDINPYLPISLEFKTKLREFNIIDANDPFQVTNALLKLLEDSINELHFLKPLSTEEQNFENLR